MIEQALQINIPAQSAKSVTSNNALDSYRRRIDYLRISLTDRCNLRCVYCMPEQGIPSLSHQDILTFEEIETFVGLAARNGIKHVRLTGGEPLVRKHITHLIRALKTIDGIESVALTTNATLLAAMAPQLKKAGLDRVNISLDSLDSEQYRAITRCGKLSDALVGIDAALEYGFDPVKINVVVARHLNQDLGAFARLSIKRPLHIRFIEYMPIGSIEDTPLSTTSQPCHAQQQPQSEQTEANVSSLPTCPSLSKDHQPHAWSSDDIVSASHMRNIIDTSLAQSGIAPLISLEQNPTQIPEGWGPARYYKINQAQGTIGFISAMSNHFCSTCNRLRLTADGKLRPCLFSDTELDLKKALRTNDLASLQSLFETALSIKPESHHKQHGTKRNMSQMGG